MFESVGDAGKIIWHAGAVFVRYPVFLLPMLGCWCVYAPVVLYTQFGINAEAMTVGQLLGTIFLLILVLSVSMGFSGLIVIDLVRQVETGDKPSIVRAVFETVRMHLIRALPIIVIWAFLWFCLMVLAAIFSKKNSDGRDEQLSMESAARTLSYGESPDSIISISAFIKALNKALRMLVFLMLPSIVWQGCHPLQATKRGLAALRLHLGRFAAGFVLSEAVAMLVFFAVGILFYVVDEGNLVLPDSVWLGVIIYSGFAWSFVMYIEQMFAAELYLWHLKWCRVNGENAKNNLPTVPLRSVEKSSLLDDVDDLSG